MADETKQTKPSRRDGRAKRKMSEEHKKKLAQSCSGWKHSEEVREKIRAARTGKPRSEETRRKLSEARKGQKFSPERLRRQRYMNKRKKELRETGVTEKQLHEAELKLNSLKAQFKAIDRKNLPETERIELENAEVEVRVIERLLAGTR